MTGVELFVAGAILSVGGQVVQAKAAKKREKAEQRRFEQQREGENRRVRLEGLRQDVIERRKKRAAKAEALRIQSQSTNLQAAQGAGGSIAAPGSTAPAVAGNVTSQLNANNQFTNQVTELSNSITAAQSQVALASAQPLPSGTSAFGSFLGSAGGTLSGNAKEISSFFT